MKHSIIGTAGHVDHGKTLLIKALTGLETDRLKEEKKRGITIELGFAYMDLPDGRRAGIIDVPGHEKFVRNMLAGVGGMDLVLLVVAADEGFMPQTREHLGILSLLEIQNGIIVLTKTDMVDEDWLEVVREDVREQVQGTFLADAPMLPVSAYTGAGIQELREEIYNQLDRSKEKNTDLPFRLPADRVFSVEGFGTVVTGTLIEGTMAEGDEGMLYPGKKPVRVRRLQVHGETVERAWAGQRVAVNLAGVKREEVERGDDLAPPNAMEPSLMLDVKLRILEDCDREIVNGSRLHFYHGARDWLVKLVLLDRDRLTKGQEAYAQLRFTEPVAVKNGDHFVVRFYSPIETVGGGTILNALPPRHKRGDEQVLAGMEVLETGDSRSRIAQEIRTLSPQFPTAAEVVKAVPGDRASFDTVVADLCEAGEVVMLSGRNLVHRTYLDGLLEKARSMLSTYHAANPLEPGMRRDELRGKVLPGRDQQIADAVILQFENEGALRNEQGYMALRDFQVVYNDGHQKLVEGVEALYKRAGLESPTPEEAQAQLGEKDKNVFKQVFRAMVQDGKLVMLTPQIYLHQAAYEGAYQKLLAHFEAHESLQLGEFRDALGTSRKYAVALLEHWDRKNITKKVGDERKLLRR